MKEKGFTKVLMDTGSGFTRDITLDSKSFPDFRGK
jgi:hypothetical protein